MNNGIKLWLDDVRYPPFGWEWAKTYDEAVKILRGGQVKTCSLDHDLGEEHYVALQNPHSYDETVKTMTVPTGYHVALLMVEESLLPETINVHSMNPAGAAAMVLALERARPQGASPVTRLSPHDVRGGAMDDDAANDGAGPEKE